MADSDAGASSNENILTDSFLHLEEIDVNLYRGVNLFHPIGARAVYGGQVVAHALRAAYTTVPSEHQAHSVHCYFLRGGSADTPILYYVDHTREGRTYCNRNVKAIQDGAPIFTMQASFKKAETDIYAHQYSMPAVPGPEGLLSSLEIMERQLKSDSVSERRKQYLEKKLTEKVTTENRPVKEQYSWKEEPMDPISYNWIRCNEHIGDGRAMTLGRLWRRDGTLAMSVAQEGVVRTFKSSL